MPLRKFSTIKRDERVSNSCDNIYLKYFQHKDTWLKSTLRDIEKKIEDDCLLIHEFKKAVDKTIPLTRLSIETENEVTTSPITVTSNASPIIHETENTLIRNTERMSILTSTTPRCCTRQQKLCKKISSIVKNLYGTKCF